MLLPEHVASGLVQTGSAHAVLQFRFLPSSFPSIQRRQNSICTMKPCLSFRPDLAKSHSAYLRSRLIEVCEEEVPSSAPRKS
jgi:hypothetical protein